MLKYFVSTTIQLAMMMLISGLAFAYASRAYGKIGSWCMRGSAIAGLLLALIMNWMKNNTNKVDTGRWNLRIYTVSLAAFLLFLLFSAVLRNRSGRILLLPALMLAITVTALILYALPEVFTYPYTVLQTEKTVLSTPFLYKMIGVFFGLALTFVMGLAVARGGSYLEKGVLFLLLFLALLILQIRQVTASFSILLAKRMIPNNHTLFVIAKHASNYNRVFVYVVLALTVVIPLILWARSFHVNEPYSNPAEHRKIRAKWRNIRRWSTTALATLAFTVITMTAINAYANRPVELSPIEDAAIVDGQMQIPFEQVADGRLHRFGYTTDNGVTIRFIVIQKPNSSAYGIGLDACDICGETGYYEKGGQVVCKLCDVVMNINTIGFKGGCNPIVIDYSIENGKILVPVEGLVQHESIFK